MIYLVLVTVITVVAIAIGFQSDNSTRNRTFIWISFILIGFLIAFRDKTVGADTMNYYNAYLAAANQRIGEGLTRTSSIETGYLLLLQILNHLSNNPQIMFVFEGILVAASYGWFICRNTKKIADSYIAIMAYLAFNLFSFQLTGYRQALAMAVCMFAYYFLEKRKFFSFLLIIIIAAQFHASAYFFIPAYFISMGKATKKKRRLIFLSGVLILSRLSYFNNAMSLISDRYDKYGIEETGNGMIFFIVLMLILLAGEYYKNCIICREYEETIVNISDVYFSLNYITCLLWFLRLFTRTAERACLFYIPATSIVLKEIARIGVLRMYNRDVTKVVISLVLFVLFIHRMQGIPYKFCF